MFFSTVPVHEVAKIKGGRFSLTAFLVLCSLKIQKPIAVDKIQCHSVPLSIWERVEKRALLQSVCVVFAASHRVWAATTECLLQANNCVLLVMECAASHHFISPFIWPELQVLAYMRQCCLNETRKIPSLAPPSLGDAVANHARHLGASSTVLLRI